MIKVVIMDDDSVFLKQLGEKVRAILDGAKFASLIHCYENMDVLPDSIMADADIFFLDIDFRDQDYSGVDIARKIRSINQTALLIFVTNYIEYAPEGYEVQAFRYILKSELDRKLENSLLQAIKKLEKVRETVQFQFSREPLTLPVSDILYIESLGHAVFIHVCSADTESKNENTHKLYSTLATLEEKLVPFGFLRVHKSFLVNMKRIKKYQYNEVMMDNGTVLPVSQKDYAEKKRQYLLWKGNQ